MPSSGRCSRTASRRSIACPASRAIICSTRCSMPARRSRWCIPATSRAPPTWRSAPPWRPASRGLFGGAGPGLAQQHARRSPPPIRPARRVLALIGQIPSQAIGKGHGMLHEIPGPDRHPAHADQMGRRASRSRRMRPALVGAGVPGMTLGTAAAGRARDRRPTCCRRAPRSILRRRCRRCAPAARRGRDRARRGPVGEGRTAA